MTPSGEKARRGARVSTGKLADRSVRSGSHTAAVDFVRSQPCLSLGSAVGAGHHPHSAAASVGARVAGCTQCCGAGRKAIGRWASQQGLARGRLDRPAAAIDLVAWLSSGWRSILLCLVALARRRIAASEPGAGGRSWYRLMAAVHRIAGCWPLPRCALAVPELIFQRPGLPATCFRSRKHWRNCNQPAPPPSSSCSKRCRRRR